MKKIKDCCILIILVIIAMVVNDRTCYAQEQTVPIFENSDVTCYLGKEYDTVVKINGFKKYSDWSIKVTDDSIVSVTEVYSGICITPLKGGKTTIGLYKGAQLRNTLNVEVIDLPIIVKTSQDTIVLSSEQTNCTLDYEYENHRAKNRGVMYKIENTEVASLTDDEFDKKIYIRAKKQGNTNLVFYNYYTDEVIRKIPISVTIHYSSILIGWKDNRFSNDFYTGETAQIQLSTTPELNEVDDPIRYSSSNPSVMTVSETGLVSAVGVGEAVITATANQTSDSVKCTVKDGNVHMKIEKQNRKDGKVCSNKVILEFDNLNYVPMSKVRIYRSNKIKGKYKCIATIDSKGTAYDSVYKDKKVKPGKAYYYKIQGYSDILNEYGPLSAPVQYCTAPNFYHTKVKIRGNRLIWNKTKGATGYSVLQCYSYSGLKYWYIKEGYFVNFETSQKRTKGLSCKITGAPKLTGYNIYKDSLKYSACVVAYAKIGKYYYVDGYPPLKSLSSLRYVENKGRQTVSYTHSVYK